MENLTSIIVLSYNTLKYTKLCIESIEAYTENYELIVVDNGSTDGSREYLMEKEGIIALCNDENLGFPAGCNMGLRMATGDALLFLNSDTIVTPNWLSNMRRALFSKEDIGAVGCMTNSCGNYQQIPVSYQTIEELIAFAEKFNCSDETKWFPWMTLTGFCFLMRREAYVEVGGFDEIYSPGNFEDDDLCMRLRRAGYL